MSWTTPATYTDPNVLTAAMLNAVRDNLLSLRNRHDQYVQLYLDNNQSVPNTTNTKVSWTTVATQVGTLWTVATPTRLTAPVTAKYAVAINLEWRNNTVGLRNMSILRSAGVQLDLQSNASPGGKSTISAYAEVQLTAGVYLEIQAFQATGAALTLHGGTVDRTRVAMWMIGT